MRIAEPMTLRSLSVRNRIWMSPMCQYRCRGGDGVPGDWHMVHYGSRAAGGFGLIIAEASGIAPEGRISNYCAGLWSDEQTAAWAPIVAFAQSMGAAMGIQLNHAGRKASTYPMLPGVQGRGTIPATEGGWQSVGPSPVAAERQAAPRELTLEEVRGIPEQFAQACRRAVDAGFDLVELHAAHGYLLHQFLSPFSNQRTDDYGGSFENRSRLLLEVVDAARSAIPESMPLLVRLSATEWLDPEGFTLDEASELSTLLKQRGVDLIDVSTSGNVAASIPVEPGYQVRFASELRRASGLPTAAVGLITSGKQAEAVLKAGDADAVMIGRASLRDAEWPINALRSLGAGADELPYPDSYFRGWR
ncbi:NADPH dehydrogenase [Corynebacterium glaucum]|uniref:NADH:flavin oxidoreductase/NADH oxidase n=1 Tax=Corynebacterium glaucum TaxID=187491 RepID=UPI0025B3140C|nr:NADH:flavin oxidoreductase/NADH oxidase [Corynebacterium glaucum]WJZ08879.1 NADPH dehydrogenase [Corynebacterium glaucum]